MWCSAVSAAYLSAREAEVGKNDEEEEGEEAKDDDDDDVDAIVGEEKNR